MDIRIYSEDSLLLPILKEMPKTFEKGQLLFNGRNEIRRFDINGLDLVAKRYKRHDCFKQIVYSFFRKNKARRSYENAQELRRRGYVTPREIAYIECWEHGLIKQVYYLCEFTDAKAIRPELIDRDPFNRELATAYAQYVATLHETGVLHRDLNPTNVLFARNEKCAVEREAPYCFQLIDINRMQFFDSAVPKAVCMENLTLFWWLTDVYRYVLQVYADSRHWTADDIQEAVRVKERHDRRWIRRKNFTAIFKHKKLKTR